MSQNKKKIIGLTGGIATGKSTASNIIRDLGYYVIDADKIARDGLTKGSSTYKDIVEAFGKGILNGEGDIDRKRLGNIIFKDQEKRKALNNIVHPFVFITIRKLIGEYKKNKPIFLDIPLLIEEKNKLHQYGLTIDEIWLVYLDEVSQLERLLKRDLIAREEALNKIKAQMSIELKRKYADRLLDNQGDKEALKIQIEKALNKII